MVIRKRVLLPMIKAPFGIVWTLVGAATPFSTWSPTRPHAWTQGHRAFRVVGALGNPIGTPRSMESGQRIGAPLAAKEPDLQAVPEVGDPGLEPGTSSLSEKRSNRLS